MENITDEIASAAGTEASNMADSASEQMPTNGGDEKPSADIPSKDVVSDDVTKSGDQEDSSEAPGHVIPSSQSVDVLGGSSGSNSVLENYPQEEGGEEKQGEGGCVSTCLHI